MNKMLVFDMDGTIADLYGVDNWLESLHAEDTRPYEVAEPLVNMELLNGVLKALQACGWQIAVTTWLAKGATRKYDAAVREVKIAWLEKYNFPYDEIHLVKYGRTKADCTRHKGGFQILIDDNEKIRNGWTLGRTIDAGNEDIITELCKLLTEELTTM